MPACRLLFACFCKQDKLSTRAICAMQHNSGAENTVSYLHATWTQPCRCDAERNPPFSTSVQDRGWCDQRLRCGLYESDKSVGFRDA